MYGITDELGILTAMIIGYIVIRFIEFVLVGIKEYYKAKDEG